MHLRSTWRLHTSSIRRAVDHTLLLQSAPPRQVTLVTERPHYHKPNRRANAAMPLMPARDTRGNTAKPTPPSVASKWPTKMRESRPQIPACWPRIPHAGKHEMPLKGRSFQPILSLQTAYRPPGPRHRAPTPTPTPSPSGSEIFSLVSHNSELQTDLYGNCTSRFQAVLSCQISHRKELAPSLEHLVTPLLTVQFPPYHIRTLPFGTHGSGLNFDFAIIQLLLQPQ